MNSYSCSLFYLLIKTEAPQFSNLSVTVQKNRHNLSTSSAFTIFVARCRWNVIITLIITSPCKEFLTGYEAVYIYYWCLTSYVQQQMRPSARRLEITILCVTMPLPGLLSQRKRYETLYDDLSFMSMIDLFFSFLLSMTRSRRIFFFIISRFCVYGQTGIVDLWQVSFTLFKNKCLH